MFYVVFGRMKNVLVLKVVSNNLRLFCVVFGSFKLLWRVSGSSCCSFRFKLSGLFCLSSCFKLL